MERLTERDEFGNADIVGVESEDLQLNLDFNEMNKVTNALNLLAAYEDTGLTPEQIAELKEENELTEESACALWGANEHKHTQIEAQQQEIEQLKAALTKAKEAIRAAWSEGSVNAAMDKASEALSKIEKALGGKEDGK